MSNEIQKNVVAFDNEVIKAAVERLATAQVEKVGIEKIKELVVFRAELIKQIYKSISNTKGAGLIAVFVEITKYIDDVQRGIGVFGDTEQLLAEYIDLDDNEAAEVKQLFDSLLSDIPERDEFIIENLNAMIESVAQRAIAITIRLKNPIE